MNGTSIITPAGGAESDRRDNRLTNDARSVAGRCLWMLLTNAKIKQDELTLKRGTILSCEKIWRGALGGRDYGLRTRKDACRKKDNHCEQT